MSSANVDKALQIRPPIAMYSLECTADVNVFFIPGDPMGITGTHRQRMAIRAHTPC